MTKRIDMERHIPALIATLGGRIGLHAQRESARALGLDLREWRVLQILGEAEGRTVNEIADRIAMLYEGKIIWVGPTSEIDRSNNPYVDQFINGRDEGPIAMMANA